MNVHILPRQIVRWGCIALVALFCSLIPSDEPNSFIPLSTVDGKTQTDAHWLLSTQAPSVNVVDTPEEILALYPEWVRRLLCESNVFYSQNPLAGKTVRFETPIDINLHGIPQVVDAINHYEALTGGVITFRQVDFDPLVGITVIEGDAENRDGGPGCGHVTCQRDPHSGFSLRVGNTGAFNSLVYVHLGSKRCDFVSEGFRPCSIVEHELAHALGLGNHFPGFTGIEGLSLELLVTITVLYRVPPGTDVAWMCVND
ncbi:MAG: hypothetical protein HZB51_05135 [Chloroflexi bacterium]|nr:hypothetical protein [Chloroflexota bacterium]